MKVLKYGRVGNTSFKIWSNLTGDIPEPDRKSKPNNSALLYYSVPVLNNIFRAPGNCLELLHS